MTYINCSFFSVLLLPLAFRYVWQTVTSLDFVKRRTQKYGRYAPVSEDDPQSQLDLAPPATLANEDHKCVEQLAVENSQDESMLRGDDPLTLKDTIRLSLEFSVLWVRLLKHPNSDYVTDDQAVSGALQSTAVRQAEADSFQANYFIAASLSYTSVASSTILTSTSSKYSSGRELKRQQQQLMIM